MSGATVFLLWAGRQMPVAARYFKRINVDNSNSIPHEIRQLLHDIAKIRRTVLEQAPDCLPAVAPIIIDAENHLHAMCSR